MAVVETPGFLREVAVALSGKERTEVIRFLAANSEAGDVMPVPGGAGGQTDGVTAAVSE